MKPKKHRGIETLKSRYGFMFILPWAIGMLIFFIIPVIQSVIYSFSSVTVDSGKINMTFSGIANYKRVLVSDPDYMSWLKETIIPIFYSLPIIILVSLVLALLLNQNFKGRLFFRALYFLPVIIASGVVIELLFSTTRSEISDLGVNESLSAGMINISDLTGQLGLGSSIAKYFNQIINRIFDLIWNCGVQIVLFLAGLQSVPSSLYEASRVEGATKWEEFWFITFPSLSRITLLVLVFTLISLITDERSELVSKVYDSMRAAVYDVSSAMIWFYFLICSVIMGIIIFAYNRLLMRRWD